MALVACGSDGNKTSPAASQPAVSSGPLAGRAPVVVTTGAAAGTLAASGYGGTSGSAAASGGVSGSASARGEGTAAVGGGAAGASGVTAPSMGQAGVSGSGAGVTTGSLPAVTDLQQPGPFTPVQGAGPANFVLFHPQELGEGGVKHPIVSWGPGAAENAGSFTTLLKHLASHGFAVISFDGTPQGQELVTAIDWMLAENDRSDSQFYQKLDTSKISAAGHSAGSIATFKIAADARLITTIHLSGGTFDPHTDISNLRAPTLFICGDPGGDGLIVGDVARPNCDIDFMNVEVPVFYGVPKGASHMSATEIGDAKLRTLIQGAFVGWLRWQLADDQTQKDKFVGDACTFCSDSAWTVQQKGLQ